LPPPHIPQSSTAEQPSLMSPQSLPIWQTFAVHAMPAAHTFAMRVPILPAPHDSPAGQLPPQLSAPPQPSGMVPQLRAPQLTCVGQPHSWGVPPPPHDLPVEHKLPQSIVLPQLSGMTPHDIAPHIALTHAAKSPPAKSNVSAMSSPAPPSSRAFQQRLSEWQK